MWEVILVYHLFQLYLVHCYFKWARHLSKLCMDFFGKQSLHLHDPIGSIALPAVSCASLVISVVQVSLSMGRCFTNWRTIRPLWSPCRLLLRPYASVFFVGLIYFDFVTACQGCKMKDQHEALLSLRTSIGSICLVLFLLWRLLWWSFCLVIWLAMISLPSSQYQFWSVESDCESNSARHQKMSLVPHASAPHSSLGSVPWWVQHVEFEGSSRYPWLVPGDCRKQKQISLGRISFPSLFGNYR